MDYLRDRLLSTIRFKRQACKLKCAKFRTGQWLENWLLKLKYPSYWTNTRIPHNVFTMIQGAIVKRYILHSDRELCFAGCTFSGEMWSLTLRLVVTLRWRRPERNRGKFHVLPETLITLIDKQTNSHRSLLQCSSRKWAYSYASRWILYLIEDVWWFILRQE